MAEEIIDGYAREVEPKAEITVQDSTETGLITGNPFESEKGFNSLFKMAKVLSGSTLIPESFRLHDRNRHGKPYGDNPDDGYAKPLHCKGKTVMEWTGLHRLT